jgi:DNA-binding CsgD family transcriptional regulator
VKFSLGSLLAWGMCELDEGRDLVEQARDLFAEVDDERSVLVATNELGYHAGFDDDGEEHERTAREVLVAAEALDDAALQVQALSSLAWATTTAGRIEGSLPVIERGIDAAHAAGKAYRVCYLNAMRAANEHWLARGHRRAELDSLKEAHPAFRDTMLLDFAAQMAWQDGDLQGAVAATLDQMAWDGGLSGRRTFGGSIAVVALAELGRHDEAAAMQRVAEAHFGGRSCWVFSRLIGWSGAVVTWLSGDEGEGLRRLALTAEEATAHGYWSWGRWMVVDLAEAAVYAGAPALSQRAEQLLGADPCPPGGPSHDGARALVAGRFDEAAEAFATAGWPLFEGRALALLGAALAGSDRARAAEVLQAAVARFDACGAVVRRERALASLATLGARGRRKKAELLGPGALSPREREVAALAARGCSAREIAERLFIGERTVETHLANAYAKLGVVSKVDLVRRAGELGL